MVSQLLSRRDLLKNAPFGFGYLALAGLCTEASATYQNPLAAKAPHFPARAKRVIFLCMPGGPSQLDSFDYKPKLAEDAGKTVASLLKNGKNDFRRSGSLLPSPYKFAQHGQSGLWVSALLPQLAKHADDLCVIKSMVTDIPNHPQAFLQLHTGEFRFTRPSVGAWVLYGLGSENRDLPGFITINPLPEWGGTQNYGNAFLPAAYQGTRLGDRTMSLAQAKISNLSSPLPGESQRQQIDLIQAMNQDLLQRKQVNTEIEGVIDSFELGFRMQNSLPQLLDIANEPTPVLTMYGIPANDFGRQCLLARRFAEAGVRYIEVCTKSNWDHHGSISNMKGACQEIDQPIAALLTDLKRRGLLDDTLVIWGGEFGRSPTAQGKTGREHNAFGYTMWLAGGGVKAGLSLGATDEYGLEAVENKVHLHDLHATVLHLLGLDHQRLTYRYGGRDYSLTDIHGRVVREIIA